MSGFLIVSVSRSLPCKFARVNWELCANQHERQVVISVRDVLESGKDEATSVTLVMVSHSYESLVVNRREVLIDLCQVLAQVELKELHG